LVHHGYSGRRRGLWAVDVDEGKPGTDSVV
jgi:hypothetical protein